MESIVNDEYPKTATWWLNLLPSAVLLDQQYGECFEPIRTGIYKVGDVDPTLDPTHTYYSEVTDAKGKRYLSPINDFVSVNQHVLDANGNLIIADYMMKNKERYLSLVSTIPARAVLLTELLVRDYLESLSQIPKASHYAPKISQMILPNHFYLYTDGYLLNTIRSLREQIGSIVGNDTWHLYFLSRHNTDLCIEKTIDYRIWYYNKHHSHERSPEL